MTKKANILEQVAERIKIERDIAFENNEVSSSFLEIGKSTDGKVIGRRYPQTDYIELEKAHSLEFDSLVNEELVFDRIEIYNSAKLTDCISTAAFSAHAYLLSQKSIKVFSQFNLGNHKIYPATVFHKGESYQYGVLHFINDLHNDLNFYKSTFYIADILMAYQFDIDIHTLDEYNKICNKISNGEYEGVGEYSYVRLKQGIFNENILPPDLFSINCSATGDYISTRLGQAIIDNGLTGFNIERIYNLKD